MTMIAAVAMSVAVQAKTVKTTFNVNGGHASMSKERIEKAAKGVPGVVSAKWNGDNHQLALVYDNTKTNPQKVQKAIAAVGHDAGNIKASDAAYNKLPACCKYRGNAKSSSNAKASNGKSNNKGGQAKGGNAKTGKQTNNAHKH